MNIALFYILFTILCEAKGIVLDPIKTKSHTHCDGASDPIILTNPFPDILLGNDLSHLVGMEWRRFDSESGKNVKLTSALEPFDSPVPNIVSYEKWGLQINNFGQKDAGIYFAVMSSTIHSTLKINFTISVTVPPTLKSEKLSVKEETNADGSKTYSCGQIATLGQPPISIIWKTTNETVLPSTYRDGYQIITVPMGKDEIEMKCEIDGNSLAYKCVPEAEKSRWDFTSTEKSQTASSNFLIYIIAGTVGFVGLVSIVVLIVVIRMRTKGGKNYNAKQKEAEVEEGHDHPDAPLVKEQGPTITSSATEKRVSNSSHSGSSYPASRHSYPRQQHENQEDYEEYEMNGKGRLPQRSSPPPPVAPKYRKKSEPIIDSRGNEVRPPEKKPRSIFLTPSMEELDKINEAVRGGKGSEPAGTIV